MPLIEKIDYPGIGQVGIWHITEELSFFNAHPMVMASISNESERLSTKRQLEWSAARYLLYHIIDQTDPPECNKDLFGKPYLDGSEMEISMSHSHDLAAVSLSLFKNGVDIQKIVNKITRIKHKFLHADELDDMDSEDDLDALHIYWGAKEALYKAHGKRKLTFKHNLRIKSFNSNKDIGQTIGYIQTDTLFETYQIYWKKINNEFILVFADQLL